MITKENFKQQKCAMHFFSFLKFNIVKKIIYKNFHKILSQISTQQQLIKLIKYFKLCSVEKTLKHFKNTSVISKRNFQRQNKCKLKQVVAHVITTCLMHHYFN